MNTVEELREKIRETDEQIFRLVGQRVALAGKIGEIKRSSGIRLRDYTVEAQVISRAEEICGSMGIERQTGRAIAKELIRAALHIQSSRDIPLYSGEKKRILIVGGLGRMGRWYSHFFSVQGHDVLINDTAPGETPFRSVRSMEEAAAGVDVIILTTPISATPQLLQRAVDAAPHALIMDGCSLKTPLIDVLKSAAHRGVRVTSIHPLFGPDTVMLADQNLIVCNCGSSEAVEEAAGLFSDTALSIIRMEVERHDELMSFVLGSTHAINIIMFLSLVKGGIGARELIRCASTTFRKQIMTTVDVARENPSLYYEIQHLNGHRDSMFTLISESLEELKNAAVSNTPESFLEIMQQGMQYFRGVSIE